MEKEEEGCDGGGGDVDLSLPVLVLDAAVAEMLERATAA
jgi:hypothetical protein